MSLNAYNNSPDFVKQYIDNVIKVEGGYSNHKDDSGGETCWGITKKVAEEYNYYYDMKDLPLTLAQHIYADGYWNKPRLYLAAEESQMIAEELFDTSVNAGYPRAIKMFQKALNGLNNKGTYFKDISVDGVMGQQTKSALKVYLNTRGNEGEKVLFNLLNCIQGAFYLKIAEGNEKNESFLYGWLKHRTVFKDV